MSTSQTNVTPFKPALAVSLAIPGRMSFPKHATIAGIIICAVAGLVSGMAYANTQMSPLEFSFLAVWAAIGAAIGAASGAVAGFVVDLLMSLMRRR